MPPLDFFRHFFGLPVFRHLEAMNHIDLTNDDVFVVEDVEYEEHEEMTHMTEHILDAQRKLKTVEDQLAAIQAQKEELERTKVCPLKQCTLM